jgi:hypothetical protein
MKHENQGKNITGTCSGGRIEERQAMARIATEHLSVGIVRVRERRRPARVRFCALDGPVRVVIEADSEHDARCLCREMAFEFICLRD